MAEDYVRPPLVAFEPVSPAVARWRFRLIVGLVFLLVLGGLAVLLFTVLLANNEGNPGLTPQGLSRAPAIAIASVTSLSVSGPNSGARRAGGHASRRRRGVSGG